MADIFEQSRDVLNKVIAFRYEYDQLAMTVANYKDPRYRKICELVVTLRLKGYKPEYTRTGQVTSVNTHDSAFIHYDNGLLVNYPTSFDKWIEFLEKALKSLEPEVPKSRKLVEELRELEYRNYLTGVYRPTADTIISHYDHNVQITVGEVETLEVIVEYVKNQKKQQKQQRSEQVEYVKKLIDQSENSKKQESNQEPKQELAKQEEPVQQVSQICRETLINAGDIAVKSNKIEWIREIQRNVRYIKRAVEKGYSYNVEQFNYILDTMLMYEVNNNKDLQRILEQTERAVLHINGQHLYYLLSQKGCEVCKSSQACKLIDIYISCKCGKHQLQPIPDEYDLKFIDQTSLDQKTPHST